jgi:hypothetical protein
MDEGFKKKDFGVCMLPAHKGKKWSAVPIDYLKYLVSEECNTGLHIKEIAQAELRQRRTPENQLDLIPGVLKEIEIKK